MLVMAYLGLMIEEAGPPEGIRSLSTRFVAITQLNARITCKAHVADVGEDEIGLDLVAEDALGEAKLVGRAVVDSKSWGKHIGQAGWESGSGNGFGPREIGR